MLSGPWRCFNGHYLCFLSSSSGSDPERRSYDEPGPLPGNPTPSHQPYSEQDSRCKVSRVSPGYFQPITLLLTWLTGLSANGNHTYTAVDVWRLFLYVSLEQDGQVVRRTLQPKASVLAYMMSHELLITSHFLMPWLMCIDRMSVRETFIRSDARLCTSSH